jgi:two-component system sensor histidine kinase KdpD
MQQSVAVEVRDRGPGLPPGAEERVFEKFFRAHPSGEVGRRGIGLGLAISRGIIEAHHGKISAYNRPGRGACFRFILPLEGTPPVIDGRG